MVAFATKNRFPSSYTIVPKVFEDGLPRQESTVARIWKCKNTFLGTFENKRIWGYFKAAEDMSQGKVLRVVTPVTSASRRVLESDLRRVGWCVVPGGVVCYLLFLIY